MTDTISSDGPKERRVQCPRCGYTMLNLQVCHLRCPNCGAELTCSDKGSFW